MTDRRRASGTSGQQAQPGQSGPAGGPGQEDNPFAPPPADAPDRPWQPRHSPAGPEGSDGNGPEGTGPDDRGDAGEEPSARTKWGSQWSSRQPGRDRDSGGFGTRKDGRGGRNGEGNGNGRGGRLRWDPRDPAQRHARYALLSGMWGFFFALFDLPPLALLLGALSLHWGISSLRGAPGARRDTGGERDRDRAEAIEGRRGTAPAPPGPPAGPPAGHTGRSRPRQQTTAAVTGLVVGSLALLTVFSAFTVKLVYKDYYDCVDTSLTTSSRDACEDLLPERLRPILGDND